MCAEKLSSPSREHALLIGASFILNISYSWILFSNDVSVSGEQFLVKTLHEPYQYNLCMRTKVCVSALLCAWECLTLNDVELQECASSVEENPSDSLLKHAPFWPLKCKRLFLHNGSAMLQAPKGVLLLQLLSALTNHFFTEVWAGRGWYAVLRWVNTDEGQLLCGAAYSPPAVGGDRR